MAKKTIKVKDLLKMDVDVDVYDNITEELAIAFCGAVELTDEGKFYFEVILNRDVELYEENGVAIVDCDDEFFPNERGVSGLTTNEFYLDMAKELFYSAAGYCTEEKYNRFFKENADVAFLV